MDIERYKEILSLIQKGRVKTIEDDELDIVLAFLVHPPRDKPEYTSFTTLPDGSAFFSKVVLDTVLVEKMTRLK